MVAQSWLDDGEPTPAERVKRLTLQADAMDAKADNIKSMMGRSPMYNYVSVWRLREQAKTLRARAVTLLVEDAT